MQKKHNDRVRGSHWIFDLSLMLNYEANDESDIVTTAADITSSGVQLE